MQSYLRPDLLEAAGVADVGDWGAAFTAPITTIEVNSTGTKLRPVTRVGKFTNLPDLLALSAAYTDVVTRDQVPVKLPALADTSTRRAHQYGPDSGIPAVLLPCFWAASAMWAYHRAALTADFTVYTNDMLGQAWRRSPSQL